MELSCTWVKAALQGAGLFAGGESARSRVAGEWRPLPVMLLPTDGSRQQWFQDERWYELIVILDDATSEISAERKVQKPDFSALLGNPVLFGIPSQGKLGFGLSFRAWRRLTRFPL